MLIGTQAADEYVESHTVGWLYIPSPAGSVFGCLGFVLLAQRHIHIHMCVCSCVCVCDTLFAIGDLRICAVSHTNTLNGDTTHMLMIVCLIICGVSMRIESGCEWRML